MPRHAPKLACSEDDLNKLVALSKSRTEQVRRVERARIILACWEGKENQQVARELGVSIPTVSKWRRRFAERSLEGLQAARQYIRHELVERLRLRRAPELFFRLDRAEREKARVEELLQRAKKRNKSPKISSPASSGKTA